MGLHVLTVRSWPEAKSRVRFLTEWDTQEPQAWTFNCFPLIILHNFYAIVDMFITPSCWKALLCFHVVYALPCPTLFSNSFLDCFFLPIFDFSEFHHSSFYIQWTLSCILKTTILFAKNWSCTTRSLEVLVNKRLCKGLPPCVLHSGFQTVCKFPCSWRKGKWTLSLNSHTEACLGGSVS